MTVPTRPRTIIGIPGCWKSRSEIVTSIVEHSGGYLFAGMVLMHVETKSHFTLEIYERDDSLVKAFSIAGRGRFSREDLAAIRDHTFCLYLSGEGGSIEAAEKFIHAANALLNCGGLAVKIESAGTAHSASGWRELCTNRDVKSLLKAFVTNIGSPGKFYSCGMHNLGYRDCVVEAEINGNEAAKLIHTFLSFLLSESPTLNSGETFSVDAEARRYRLFEEVCSRDSEEDPFHNSYGIWKLVPA